ncbi:MAG: primosomal protein N' [Proteobacteria bacterium]|jgi:primosomal protein N' (replication factor Y)|nr:primosomal protein N' [Pseudomonadota bacterium]
MSIARVALPVAAFETFDYWIPEGLAAGPGAVVRVNLAGRHRIGVVTAVDGTSAHAERLLPIDEVIEGVRLPGEIIALAEFVSRYYQCAAGMAFDLALPPIARSGAVSRRPASRARATRIDREADAALHARDASDASDAPDVAPAGSRAPELNAAQQDAADAVAASFGSFAAFVLFGVTGSGKTEVYLQAAREAVARGGQVLILVPEINLTPQFEERVRATLPQVHAVTLHSGLPAGTRRANWEAAASGAAGVVLGTRLAVFTALPHLALVVVDEEHDDSFKQQEGVRYHARDLALWRARRRGVPIVLGSATPSIDTWRRARAREARLLTLGSRAAAGTVAPAIAFAPVRGAVVAGGLTPQLVDALAGALARREQALVFVNRRGYATSLKCSACAWEASCPRCTARLVVHRGPDRLRCHHCAHAERLPHRCPACGNVDILAAGFGTQRLEEAIRTAFPTARVARVDRDTTRGRDAFASVRRRVDAHEVDILVGTQMLAKGHDFGRLTLVGVLGADNALYSADFRATERLTALLVQVAGRAGRAGPPGRVIVQTDFPDHPVYRALAAADYAQFADDVLAEREAAMLPPATRIALLSGEAHERADVDRFLAQAFECGRGLAGTVARSDDRIELFGPVPATLARRAGFERGQVLVQSHRRAVLQAFLPRWREAIERSSPRRVRWVIDVDPVTF